MILLDTSVVIDWLRGKDPKLRGLLPALPVAICGITQAEILNGSRDAAHRRQLLADLAHFPVIPIPADLWRAVGDNLAALRQRGITVPFQDVVIATLAAESNIEVWARDPHFAMMRKAIPLRLYQEPP